MRECLLVLPVSVLVLLSAWLVIHGRSGPVMNRFYLTRTFTKLDTVQSYPVSLLLNEDCSRTG